MSNVRRYHAAGVGGRTGMRISDGAFDLDDFMTAGRKAMNPAYTAAPMRTLIEDESSVDVEERASSSMMIAHSPGPSPRSTIRRSQAPSSSSPFLSSPGTARNAPSSAKSGKTASPLESIRLQFLSKDHLGSSSISSPTRGRESKKQKMQSTDPDARRKAKALDPRRSHATADQNRNVFAPIAEPNGTVIEDPRYDDHEAPSIVSTSDEDEVIGSLSVTQQEDELPNTNRYSSIPRNPKHADSLSTKGQKSRSKPSKSILAKAADGQRKPRPPKEKNSATNQSQPPPKSIGDAEGKQRAFEIYERQNEEKTSQRQRAVVEKIPSSFHRQTSVDAIDGHDDAVRRGSRYRYKPLEYWRGEKARFGRPSLPKEREAQIGHETIDGDAFEDHFAGAIPPVSVLKEIIRVPREEGEGTFSGMKIRKERSKDIDKPSNVKKAKSSKADSVMTRLDPLGPTHHAEAGWDKDTEMRATVWDPATDCEIEMQVACTSSQVRTRLAVNSTFGFEKVFVVDHAMATGILSILVDGQKPLKNSKDNNYTFVVLEGAVKVHLYNSSFVIAPHGMFFVPRGNDYSIENISKRVAKVAFTQCRSA